MFLVELILPAEAVPISGCPGLATETSQTPSRCPENWRTKEHPIVGPLKLDTILLV